jgi:hypothetical protein
MTTEQKIIRAKVGLPGARQAARQCQQGAVRNLGEEKKTDEALTGLAKAAVNQEARQAAE